MFDFSQSINIMIAGFILILARVSGMLMAMPIIGSKLVPGKMKIILSISLSILVFFMQQSKIVALAEMNLFFLGLSVAYQLIIGIALGFVVSLLFQSFILAGQMIAMQMGLGFAQLMDPQSGVSVPVVGQFYMMLATLLYLSMNGHLYLIGVLIQSFDTLSLDIAQARELDFHFLASLGGMVFIYGLTISLPIIVTLLITNCIFGIIAKASPQINIFSLGFSVAIIVGIGLVWLTLPLIEHLFADIAHYFHEQLEYITPLS